MRQPCGDDLTASVLEKLYDFLGMITRGKIHIIKRYAQQGIAHSPPHKTHFAGIGQTRKYFLILFLQNPGKISHNFLC
jgi:hypothetical protein